MRNDVCQSAAVFALHQLAILSGTALYYTVTNITINLSALHTRTAAGCFHLGFKGTTIRSC